MISEDKLSLNEVYLLIVTLLLHVLRLHVNNYAHRDIKPVNILFFENVENPWKLSDYGVSL